MQLVHEQHGQVSLQLKRIAAGVGALEQVGWAGRAGQAGRPLASRQVAGSWCGMGSSVLADNFTQSPSRGISVTGVSSACLCVSVFLCLPSSYHSCWGDTDRSNPHAERILRIQTAMWFHLCCHDVLACVHLRPAQRVGDIAQMQQAPLLAPSVSNGEFIFIG